MLALTDARWTRIEQTPKQKLDILTPEEQAEFEAICVAETIRDFSLLKNSDFEKLYDLSIPFSARSQKFFEAESFMDEAHRDFPTNHELLGHLVHSPDENTGVSLFGAIATLINENNGEIISGDLHVTYFIPNPEKDEYRQPEGIIFQHGRHALPLLDSMSSSQMVFLPYQREGTYHALNGHTYEASSLRRYHHENYVGLSSALATELKLLN